MNWIKKQLKRFRTWIIFGVLGVSVALAATVVNPPNEPIIEEPKTIQQRLVGKTVEEKVEIKSIEIAKIDSVAKVDRKDYSIEIVEINKIENGIEVFARAWNKNGQIGFGKDGTVDIERFRIQINGGGINGHLTHLVVEDSLGDIEIEYVNEDLTTYTVKYREDLLENLLINLEHTISVMNQKSDSSKIVSGKIGSTTSTFNPNAGVANPMDASIRRNGSANESFASIISGNGTSLTGGSFQLNAHTSTNPNFRELHRAAFGFDTSTIDDGDVVDSATLSLFSDLSETVLDDEDIDIMEAVIANEGSIATSDFQNGFNNTTRFATGIAISAWNVGSYTDYPLNASGIAHIDITGNSYFGMMHQWDFDGSFGGTWSANGNNRVRLKNAEDADSNKHPKLVVEHSVPPAAEPRPRRLEIIIIE